MPDDGMLKEIRDDIKTLLTTSAATSQRVAHMEEEVDILSVKVDTHSQALSGMSADVITKEDCGIIRSKMNNRVADKRRNWIGILGVTAAFVAAGAAIMAVVKAGML